MRTRPEVWIPGLNHLGGHENLRLFCFPFAGGSASSFKPWRAAIGPELEVYPVQYPGRETRWRDPGFENVGSLVDALAEDLGLLWKGNFAFWGHSFGGLIAFEVATRLLDRGLTLPKHLFISGSRAPDLPAKNPIHQLPDPEFLLALQKFDGMRREILEHSELVSLLLPVIRHDFHLFEEYKFVRREPLPIPISVLGGLQDENVPVSDMLAWSSHTSRTFRSRFLEGGHFFLFDAIPEITSFILEDLRTSGALQKGACGGTGRDGAKE